MTQGSCCMPIFPWPVAKHSPLSCRLKGSYRSKVSSCTSKQSTLKAPMLRSRLCSSLCRAQSSSCRTQSIPCSMQSSPCKEVHSRCKTASSCCRAQSSSLKMPKLQGRRQRLPTMLKLISCSRTWCWRSRLCMTTGTAIPNAPIAEQAHRGPAKKPLPPLGDVPIHGLDYLGVFCGSATDRATVNLLLQDCSLICQFAALRLRPNLLSCKHLVLLFSVSDQAEAEVINRATSAMQWLLV